MRRMLLALALLLPPAGARACGAIVLPANVTLGSPNAPDSFHPILGNGSFADENAIDLMYRPLFWYRADGSIDWARSVASAVAVGAGDTRFTVTLRPWHWSDGVPVGSGDLLYAWSLIRALGPAYYSWGLGGVPDDIASIAAPDARTVVVTLRRPRNPDWFIALGLSQLVPIPAHAWRRFPLAAQQSRQNDPRFFAVVDGPFRLASLHVGRDAVFVPNPTYEGHRPDYPRFVDDFLTSEDPLEALRTDALDAALLPSTLDRAHPFADTRRVPLGAQGSMNTVFLNFRNRSVPFFTDVRVRQALALAVDQDQLIRTVFAGHALPQHGFVPTSDPAWLPPELRDGQGPLRYDPARARALLDAAGWHAGVDGIRRDNGRSLAFRMLADSSSNTAIAIAQVLAADFRRVDVAVEIKEIDFNGIIATAVGPHDGWEALLMNWGSGAYPDGTQWFGTTSTYNWGGFRDPTVDRLLSAATATAGDGPLWALERRIATLQPMIFLPDASPVLLARDDLAGLDRLAGPGGEFSPEYLSWKGSCDAPHA